MKVLVADLFSAAGIEELKSQGIEVHYEASLNGESLAKAMAEFQPHVLVVRSTKVTKDIIDADQSLQMVVRAGAGYDTIDVAHCASLGIYVTNCPGKNAHAVAELTLGLIIAIDRRIPENDHLLKEAKWNKGAYANCQGLKGKTLGLVGTGSIGTLVAERALAFEMEVIAYVRSPKPDLAKKGIKQTDNLEEVLAVSDIVSVHIPGGKATEGMVDAKFLGAMKADAMLINTSRASVVNEEHLLEHMNAHPAFWYGTDVFKGEPTGKDGVFDHPLAKHAHSVATHHIGASTKQAEAAIGDEAVRIIRKFASTGLVDDGNCVNREQSSGGLHKMSIRHLDRVGVLAHVFHVFASAEFNVQELENIVFKDRQACVANIKFQGDSEKVEHVVAEIKKNENVLDVSV